MFARRRAVGTTPTLLVDGSGGSVTNPVRALVHVVSGDLLVGGVDLDVGDDKYITYVEGAYVGVDLVGEPIWCVSASTTTFEIQAAGTPTAPE